MGRIWSDWEPAEQMEPFNALHRHQLMENEPPEHTRMRRLLAGAFAKGHVERMRPRIETLADAMLDELDPSGPVDILADYAEPMPVYVIADLLGVPREDHVRLRAPLARVELEITLRRLVERFPCITLAGAPPRRPTWVLRGYSSVPVDLGA